MYFTGIINAYVPRQGFISVAAHEMGMHRYALKENKTNLADAELFTTIAK